jgi:hypothetical protein
LTNEELIELVTRAIVHTDPNYTSLPPCRSRKTADWRSLPELGPTHPLAQDAATKLVHAIQVEDDLRQIDTQHGDPHSPSSKVEAATGAIASGAGR